MKFSMTGQENGDLSIQVTAWAGLTVYVCFTLYVRNVWRHQSGNNIVNQWSPSAGISNFYQGNPDMELQL